MNAAGEELVGNPSPNELLLLNQQTTVREAYRVSLNVGCLREIEGPYLISAVMCSAMLW